ncbi:dephospho-CoA kinase [Bacteroidia bacterium]|nr:dephospho-CoA kinase [Bacteroidia bacterium]
MLSVGITGGMGSGKSLVCKVLQAWGIPIFCADNEAKKMYNENEHLREQLVNLYGQTIYKNNCFQPAELSRKVFGNEQALSQLTALVHPLVQQAFEQWRANQHAPYVVQEAALLCESGAHTKMNFVVQVTAPQDVRIARVLQRSPHLTKQQIEQRILHQWTDAQRSLYAHFTITNDDKTALLPQILELHTTLQSGI